MGFIEMGDSILVMHPNWLGDVIFSTPFIRNLRKNFPDTKIISSVVGRCMPVLEANPYIDKVLEFDEKGLQSSFLEKVRFVRGIKKESLSAVFLLRPSFTRTAIVFFSGCKSRIGHYSGKSGFLLTDTVKVDPLKVHRADYYLALLKNAGLSIDEQGCEFFYTDEDKEKAVAILLEKGVKKDDRFCVLNPGGNWFLKRWSPENFAGVACAISERYGIKVLISGAAKDASLASQIADKAACGVVSLAGSTSLRELAAVIDMCEFFVSADSGPLHIAAARNARTVAIFGPTRPELTGPYKCDCSRVRILQKQLSCNESACYEDMCSHMKCMNAVLVEDVLKEIETFK